MLVVNRDTRVGMTADGLTTIRASKMAREHGVIDPFAHWFRTEAGDFLAEKAIELDSVYATFNITRYGYTTQRLSELAHHYQQMVFIGSGFDCRAMWLDSIQLQNVQVYEVETQKKLDEKMMVFQQRGVQVPANTHHIAADLRELHRIPSLLTQHGFHPQKPTLVLTEGVFFFLPTETTMKILDPRWLPLAPGSHVIFDGWSDERVNTLNERTPAAFNGVKLFRNFPFFEDTMHLEEGLLRYGYDHIQLHPLETLAPSVFQQPVDTEFANGWVMVEACV